MHMMCTAAHAGMRSKHVRDDNSIYAYEYKIMLYRDLPCIKIKGASSLAKCLLGYHYAHDMYMNRCI